MTKEEILTMPPQIPDTKSKEGILKLFIHPSYVDGLMDSSRNSIFNAMQQYADQETALTESQRKEWADMCIKKQARIEELETTHERESKLLYKKDTDLMIAQDTIERLKGLIEKAHDDGYDSSEKYSKSLSWLGFKTDNNL